MNDTMKLIASLRPSVLDPGADPDRRAMDLAIVNLPEDRREVAAPRRRRVGLPVAVAATVAVVTAAVVTMISNDSVGQRGATTLSARGILLAAASKSAAQKDTGHYWRVDLRSRYLNAATTPGLLAHDHQPSSWPVSTTCKATLWGARSAAESSWLTYTQTMRPLTAAGDKALDGGAGAVKGENACVVGALGGFGGASDGVERIPFNSMRNWALTSSLSKPVTMADIQHLPADPGRLKAVLDRWATGPSVLSKDRVTFYQAETLLIDMPITSKVRAALYRVLADLPLVRTKGSVADPLGRNGVGLEIPVSGTIQSTEIIIDPHTGKILAAIDRRPRGGMGSGYTAVVGQRWTDQAPG